MILFGIFFITSSTHQQGINHHERSFVISVIITSLLQRKRDLETIGNILTVGWR